MSNTVSIALAGVRGYGQQYLEQLLQNAPDYVQLTACVDPAPEGCEYLAELTDRNIPVHPSLDAMYRHTRPDLMILASPIHMHCPQTCQSLSHGSNVLCEKPLTATIQEASDMAEAERASERFVAVGYQWSYSAAIQSLKNDIMSGKLGRPVRLSTFVSWPRAQSYYSRNNWAGAQRSTSGAWVLDSPANNATAHYLHNMFYIMGSAINTSAMPTEVTAELYRSNDISNYDTAAMRCQCDNDAEVLFYTSHSVPTLIGPIAKYEFENAIVSFEWNAKESFTAKFADGSTKDYGNPYDGHYNKVWQSAESIVKNTPLPCGIKAASAQTLAINGAQESQPDIVDIPPELIRRTDSADPVTYAEGLQEVLRRCFDETALPSELDSVEWSEPGRCIDVRDYRLFPKE